MAQTDTGGRGSHAAPQRDDAEGFDLNRLPDDFYDDPFPAYHRLRRRHPVYRCPDGSFLLTRYRDLITVYRDARRFSSDKTREFRPKFGDGPLFDQHTTSLVFNDPPLHTKVRKLFGDALSGRAVEAMTPVLTRLVDALLDEIAAKGTFDLVADYAGAIPVEVIGNLLRVPRDERAPLRGWSLAILGALEPSLSDEQLQRGNRAVSEFYEYLKGLVADRRRHLSDDPDDILSRLLRGGDSPAEALSEFELLHQCIFLLNAGHETTTNLIANGVIALLRHPGERRRLLRQPELVDSAVEELLRFESPNQFGNRRTTEDVVISDVSLPSGSYIHLCIGAANRDPEVFREPDTLDIARAPNRHLAFGSGIHTCAGLSVARLEGKLAIPRILERFPELELCGQPRRSRRARFRGWALARMRAGRG
jgi:cytochrome P450